MNTTAIYRKPNGKFPIFRCPDAQWGTAITESHKNIEAPAPMPWDHDMWRDPARYGYVNENSAEEDIAKAWEAEARAFLPDGAPDVIVQGCAKAMRLGASPMPFLINQILA